MNQQQELHLLLQPSIDPATGHRPVLSGLTIAVDETAATARLSLRADSNTPDNPALQLQFGLRSSADSLTTKEIKEVAIADFSPTANHLGPNTAEGSLALDRDGRANQQVNLQRELNLADRFGAPKVSLVGPDLAQAATVMEAPR